MRKSIAIAAVMLLPILMGADGGCDGDSLPTARQVELNIPASLRSCPGLPASPGNGATKRQTAQYIVRLYAAARACKVNMGEIDRLYSRYQSQVSKLTK